MSRIYDALKRAERERTEVVDDEAKKAAAAPIQQPARSVFRLGSTYYATPKIAENDLLSETPTDADLSSELAFENIRQTTWSPALEQLPALEIRGPLIEQFRGLRSRVHEIRQAAPLKTISICSSISGEGKSFIAANLALALASSKTRVLLIDGDMRRASLHKLLGVKQETGLAEFLAGTASLYEGLKRMRAETSSGTAHDALTSLAFLSAGMVTEKAADLSGNGRFKQLLASAAPYFDWVILDSSPVNLVADGINLARACDGIVFIARSGYTKFDAAKRGLAELRGSKLLGVVLNAIEDLSTSSYYGYDSVINNEVKMPTL